MPAEIQLRELYIDYLQDLYSAETQSANAMPRFIEKITSPKVKEYVQDHLRETTQQIERLDRVFEVLKQKPAGKISAGMAGVLEQGIQEMAAIVESADLMDAVLVGACHKVEHYEISSYGTVITFAQLLSETEAVKLLTKTLDEEKAAEEKLTQFRLTEVMQSPDTLITNNPEGRSLKKQLTANDSLGG